MKEKNGGAAFRMTLRDYFAAKAMQSLLVINGQINPPPQIMETIAKASYDMAQALRDRKDRL